MLQRHLNHVVDVFNAVVNMQKEFSIKTSIRLRFSHLGKISNLAPFMMTLQQGAYDKMS